MPQPKIIVRSSMFGLLLAVGIFAWWAQSSPPVRAAYQDGQATSQAGQASRHSSLPVRGEFVDNQIGLAPEYGQRQIREAYYKGVMSKVEDPGDQTEDTKVSIYDSAGMVDPLPTAESAAVVIGSVLGGKAFVSKDGTYVYSDYQSRK
jgi:hypothetical protein